MDEHIRTKLLKLIGKKIQTSRKGKLTQEQLAKELKLTRTSITNIETGNQGVQVDALWQISDILGVSIQELLPTKDEMGTVYDQLPEDIDRKWIEEVKKEVKKYE